MTQPDRLEGAFQRLLGRNGSQLGFSGCTLHEGRPQVLSVTAVGVLPFSVALAGVGGPPPGSCWLSQSIEMN